MRVDVWADIICPFCGIGQRRLEAAVSSFAQGAQLEIRHRSFQIAPEIASGKVMSVGAFLEAHRGMSRAASRTSGERLEAAARAEGLSPFHVVENEVGQTQLVHELLALASEKGKHAQAWKLVLEGYWGRRLPLWTAEDLVPVARELGLDVEETRRALETGAYRDRVREDQREAAELGVRGVPFFLIDGRLGVMGAQPRETLVGALTQGWQSRDEG